MSEPVVLQARNEPQQIVRAAGAIPTVVGQLGSIGPQGPAGVGVPGGGTTGQVLAKASGADYDDHWVDATAAGSFQPLDVDLTTIAALDSATAGALVTDGAGWIRKTYAQLKTALSLVKADVGLGSVDNTSDAAKPVSTAQQTALDLKANLASPALTGNPTAPTPAAADNDTSIATTAFVQGELTAKAPLASPTFTGDPKAPTASPGDNDTSIATTAFVTAAVAAGGGGGAASSIQTASAPTTEGGVQWDATLDYLKIHDGTSAKGASGAGWQSRMAWPPYTAGESPGTSTSFTLVSGGAVAIPIHLVAPGRLRSILLRNNTATARTLEAGVYVQVGNSATAQRLASMASHTAALSAYDQADFDSQPVVLPPGELWLVIRNTHASSISLGTVSATGALIGSNRGIASISALGSTLDLSTGWAGIGDRIIAGLQFVTFGESALN